MAAVAGLPADVSGGHDAPLLETVGLAKTFGGLRAVQPVNFSLDRGELRAIIGPNGAGKTTLVSMICGRIRPTAGTVRFGGRDITGMPAHERVALGIVYTFQIISIFKNQSVLDNVALAAQRRLARGILSGFTIARGLLAERTDAALAAVGLLDARGREAGSLPHGHQRLLEVAMALALEPAVLIMDEPTQGLSPDEIAGLTPLIRAIAEKATILLIEHNVRVVFELSRKITVMDKGSIIAEGTPRQIEANPQVQRVYLGG